MPLASTFLSKHSGHRKERTFTWMHVITQRGRFMCVRCHPWEMQRKMGCVSLINLEGRQSKAAGCQVVELDRCKREINVPFVVDKDSVCCQTLKNGWVGPLRRAIASRVVGHCLMHLNLEAMHQFLPRLRLGGFVSIRDDSLGTSFAYDHLSQEHVDQIIGCHVLATGDEQATLGKLLHHSHNSVITSHGRRSPETQKTDTLCHLVSGTSKGLGYLAVLTRCDLAAWYTSQLRM